MPASRVHLAHPLASEPAMLSRLSRTAQEGFIPSDHEATVAPRCSTKGLWRVFALSRSAMP